MIEAVTTTNIGKSEREVASRLSTFEKADSTLLSKRKLLRRTDSKFLMSERDVPSLLGNLKPNYSVLLASEQTIASYRTLYFDTRDFRCFHDHRRGKRPRYKTRIRHYDDRKVSYLEIKKKNSANVTVKSRMEIPFDTSCLDTSEAIEFIGAHTPIKGREFHPVLWTNFSRLTLLNDRHNERVTIDINLSFISDEQVVAMTGVAILEVKQPSFSMQTPIMRDLAKRRIRRKSASKYCAALNATRKQLANNRLLPSFRAMERLRV